MQGREGEAGAPLLLISLMQEKSQAKKIDTSQLQYSFFRLFLSLLHGYREFLVLPTAGVPEPSEIFKKAKFLEVIEETLFRRNGEGGGGRTTC